MGRGTTILRANPTTVHVMSDRRVRSLQDVHLDVC
ncbi:hypothetical protein QFZ96_007395 [Paraburkholderia youngii]